MTRRLKPVETGYHQDRRCLDGTRTGLLKKITDWVVGQEDATHGNTYWIYGLPGIGKTSLAHSICAKLDYQKQLAGSFFCRMNDPDLSEPRKILPTLINKLAIIFPPFRAIVADRLHKTPNLTPESMEYAVFLEFIRALLHPPKKALVFVIDALDECGSAQSRSNILKALTDAAAEAPWLKVIITSRPEVDIQDFFHSLTQLSYWECDLIADQEATSDLRIFAKHRFSTSVDSQTR